MTATNIPTFVPADFTGLHTVVDHEEGGEHLPQDGDVKFMCSVETLLADVKRYWQDDESGDPAEATLFGT